MIKKSTQQSKAPHVGAILRSYVRNQRIYQAALARQIGKTSQSVALYQKQASIQTKNLWDICQVLKHNFFMDIAQMLPDTFSTETNIFEAKDKRIAELEEENKILRAEKAVLLERGK